MGAPISARGVRKAFRITNSLIDKVADGFGLVLWLTCVYIPLDVIVRVADKPLELRAWFAFWALVLVHRCGQSGD